ncbi:thermostable hemolysin [Roseovarius amoyensis]|uniref:thermostable hemolysin n=1 Tax=Roseovarius amoyensis TaxID=2211448 RepID=UPI000DBE9F13|nr:thermostable hemolysin [Roseovarius amoyensis]
MKIDFLTREGPARAAAERHIRNVYREAYGAMITEFAPRLVTVQNRSGQILCAAGLRTARDGFFSDTYLDGGFGRSLLGADDQPTPRDRIMEVVSLASTTPFPVLAMLDVMVDWGRARGMTCGVFTATASLRRLLDRTRLDYTRLAPADPSRIAASDSWGSYYAHDPWVCACADRQFAPVQLSPRNQMAKLRRKAS